MADRSLARDEVAGPVNPNQPERVIKGLLIDDDPEDSLLIMHYLAAPDWPSFKFVFDCAETLESGIQMLDEHGADVILLDMTLPDSRGLETVSRAFARARDVPIVVLTGLSDEKVGVEALKLGAQDFLVKGSFDVYALKRAIGYAVERYRLQANLRGLVERAPDGVAIADEEGNIAYVNDRAEILLGRKKSELLGRPLEGSASGEMEISSEGGARILEVRMADIEWRERPARLAWLRDITELRRMEQLKAEVRERRRLDEIKDQFISAVSHEMRNPLTIVKAACSNLREGLCGSLSEEQEKIMEIQNRNIQRLQKIVDNILDLSRLESGRAEIRYRAIETAEVLHDIAGGFGMLAADRRLTIDEDIEEDLPSVHADPDLFVQVLSNLVDNALRFAKSRILIRASSVDGARPQASRGVPEPRGKGASKAAPRAAASGVLEKRHYVQFSVEDDGPGVPADRVGELFNKFVQISRRSDGHGYKGTGLGLAICKEIVERQGGSIWAESGDGRGGRFHFTLPSHHEVDAAPGRKP